MLRRWREAESILERWSSRPAGGSWTLSAERRPRLSPSPVKTSSFKLPTAEVVETVYLKLPDGRIVPRRSDETVTRPPLPARKA